jgi:hypothetical protein
MTGHTDTPSLPVSTFRVGEAVYAVLGGGSQSDVGLLQRVEIGRG